MYVSSNGFYFLKLGLSINEYEYGIVVYPGEIKKIITSAQL